MASTAGAGKDPLEGHPKYQIVCALNSGSFGFVNLYRNIQTNENVAIKFLERGEKVNK
jgi:serine/threonine-protein kinase SRK2